MRVKEERQVREAREKTQVRKAWARCRDQILLPAEAGGCWRGVIFGGCGRVVTIRTGCVMHEGAMGAVTEGGWGLGFRGGDVLG